MAVKTTKQKSGSSQAASATATRFESARLDSLFVALDAVAWMDAPDGTQIAQFADIDPRTAGKLLKNALQIGLVDVLAGKKYISSVPYPYKGTIEQKKSVVRDALLRLPLLVSMRQFIKLGDSVESSLRKAATIQGIKPFDPANLRPLLEWANSLNALNPDVNAEELLEIAESEKTKRHHDDRLRRVAFISHSSKDKEFVRELAGDLLKHDVGVWLDEQRIKVGDSIPDKIAQGLASSDYFLLISSKNSAQSEWVRMELNNALVNEVQKRKVHILPLKLDDAPLPLAVADKKYADFSKSYRIGLQELLSVLREKIDD